MEVRYKQGIVYVVPVKFHHELERSVKMIAESEEKLANSFLSLHPPSDVHKGLSLYFKNRGWSTSAEPTT